VNTDFGIKIEGQDCKKYSARGRYLWEVGKINGGDKGG
jgi:hypothetical protein